MSVLVLVLWPVSCVLAFLLGALCYHGVRILAVRPIYKASAPMDAGMNERKMKVIADKAAAAQAVVYLQGIHLTQDEYNGVKVDPRGRVVKAE